MGKSQKKAQAVLDADSNSGKEKLSRLQSSQSIVTTALQSWGYSDELTEILTSPFRSFSVEIPVKMDNGQVKLFKAHRVQHNDAAGSAIGSVILHPELQESDVQALAIRTSLQSGILNIPFSGASGAIICNPSELSFTELEQLSRGYVRAILPILIATQDVVTPDIPTNANIQLMAWMYDELTRLRPERRVECLTGKPESLGGIKGREFSIAKGALYSLRASAERLGKDIANAKVIIHGFGNTGAYLAKRIEDEGGQVIGVSDGHGALYDEDGLDVDYLLDRRDSFGMVTNLFKKSISNEKLLASECDILVDASIDRSVMTTKAVSAIKANLVLETAKRTLTHETTDILKKKNVLVIPEIVSGLGNLALSYFETIQSHQGYSYTVSEVDQKLQTFMKEAFNSVYDLAKSKDLNMREAAHMVGIKRHAEACKYRGWA